MTTELTALIQRLRAGCPTYVVGPGIVSCKYTETQALLTEAADALEGLMAEKSIVDSASALSERPTSPEDRGTLALALVEELYEQAHEYWTEESDCKGEMRELGIPDDADAVVQLSIGQLRKIVFPRTTDAHFRGALKTASEPSEHPAVAAPDVVAAQEKTREEAVRVCREREGQLRRKAAEYKGVDIETAVLYERYANIAGGCAELVSHALPAEPNAAPDEKGK